MFKTLITDTLLESVGAPVVTHKGESIGKIAEITREAKWHYVEYIILKSNAFFGRRPRFFAIPASSRFIDINGDDAVVLQIEKDDIPFAKGVAADKCPRPNVKYGNSIFELYNYKMPAEWQSNYLEGGPTPEAAYPKADRML